MKSSAFGVRLYYKNFRMLNILSEKCCNHSVWEPRPFTGSRDFLQGAESRAGKKIKVARAVAAKHYLVGAGARAGKNNLKTAPRSREMEPLNFF